jgi:hypothetical protein
MHAVIRSYTGASQLITEVERKRQDAEAMLRGIEGFVSYYAIRTGDTMTVVAFFDSQAGAAESTRRASAWVKENLPGASISPPQVVEGDVFVHFGR